MKYFLTLILAMLTACASSVPVTTKFPTAPTLLLESCPPLVLLEGSSTVLSTLTKTVVENYTTYHKCAANLSAWTEWYNAQKKIFEELN